MLRQIGFVLMLNIVYIIIPLVVSWNPNIRKLLGIHAITSSTVNEIRDEVFRQQLDNLFSSPSILFHFSETVDSWNQDNHLLYSIIGTGSICLMTEIYTRTYLKKLVDIPQYVSLRRNFRIGVATFLCIFFRSVDNVI
jgi:hypothetical protein